MSEPLYIGIDAANADVELIAQKGGVATACSAPGMYAKRSGIEDDADLLATFILGTVPLSEHGNTEGICIGVPNTSGFQNDSFARRLREALGSAFASCAITVEDHAFVALDATFECESGMVVVAGTGSCVVARTEENDVLRAGDWGLRIGDEGSAAAIGIAALRAIAADFDGGEPTVLRRQLGEQCGEDSPVALSRRVNADDWKAESLAPLAIAAAEGGDWVCTRILKMQANALAQRAGWVATRASAPVASRIALAGRLTEESYYRACLAEALVRHLPQWRVLRPARRPVHGALARAQRFALVADSRD